MKHTLLLLLLFVACGPDYAVLAPAPTISPEAPITIEAALQPYLDKFAIDIGTPVTGVSVIFERMNNSISGACTVYGNGVRVVKIDPTYWTQGSLNYREQMIYHELGHCVLNRVHDDRTDGVGCPVSIMRSATFGDNDCYARNKAAYYRELQHQ